MNIPQYYVLIMCFLRTVHNADGIVDVMLEDLVLPLKLVVLAGDTIESLGKGTNHL